MNGHASNSTNQSVRAADKGWLEHGFEDSVNSGAEKRLLETKVLDWSFVYTQTAVMQHCICTRQRAQGEWVAVTAIRKAAMITP